MTAYHSAFEEVAELLSSAGANRLSALRASVDVQQRMEVLIHKSKEESLTATEKDELDHYIVLERLVRLAKIHARANQTC
jgi:hypothetical protein